MRSVKLSQEGSERGGRTEPGQDQQHGGAERRAARPAQRDQAPGSQRPGRPDGTGSAVRPGRIRKATAEPAAQASQPRRLSTRPTPARWAPPAIGVPASARNKPNVTMLSPVASSAPIRRRLPPSAMSTALAVQAAR